MRARRITIGVAVLAAVVSVAAGCTKQASAPKVALCPAFQRWNALREASARVVRPPLPQATLRSLSTRTLTALTAVGDGATPDIANDVRTLVDEEAAANRVLVEAWGGDGVALGAEADANDAVSAVDWALRAGVPVGGRSVDAAELATQTDRVVDRLTLACGAPPADWHALTDDVGLTATAGRVAYVSGSQTLVAGDLHPDGTLSANSTVGRGSRMLAPAFSPDGTMLAYQDGTTLRIADADGGHPRAAVADGEWGACPAWSPSSRELVLDLRLRPGAWVVARVDVATGRFTAVTVARPLRQTPCVSYLSEDELLTVLRDPVTDADAAVGTMTLDGRTGPPFAGFPGCVANPPRRSPDGRLVAIEVACGDPYKSGIWLAPTMGGPPRQVITGHPGEPQWTPDGTQLLFSYVGLGEPVDQPTLWLASLDGSRAHRVGGAVASPASWPSMRLQTLGAPTTVTSTTVPPTTGSPTPTTVTSTTVAPAAGPPTSTTSTTVTPTTVTPTTG